MFGLTVAPDDDDFSVLQPKTHITFEFILMPSRILIKQSVMFRHGREASGGWDSRTNFCLHHRSTVSQLKEGGQVTIPQGTYFTGRGWGVKRDIL